MPHGESWFSLLPFYPKLLSFFQEMLGHSFVEKKLLPSVQHVLAAITVFILVSILALRGNKQLRAAKDGGLLPSEHFDTRNFFEVIAEALYKQMRQIIGKEARIYFPIVGSLAMFIFFSNIFGLIPGFSPPTDNWNTTLACGLFVFAYYNYHGFRTNGLGHLGHMINPVGTWWGWFLAPLMFPIELISHASRPLSLSLRLMGNMIGDHQVLGQISSKMSFFVPMPFFALGLIVCIVQTLVFTLLSMVYLSLAVSHASHEDTHQNSSHAEAVG